MKPLLKTLPQMGETEGAKNKKQMKKTYITPAIFVMEMKAENMLAVSSVQMDSSAEKAGSASWTNKKGWSSENFMPGNEDEYVEE